MRAGGRSRVFEPRSLPPDQPIARNNGHTPSPVPGARGFVGWAVVS